MHFNLFPTLLLAAASIPGSFASSDQHRSCKAYGYHPSDVIKRDVAIIGGGSAGIYSAISLKDKGKSVIVIEKKGRIGGHAETYIDPGTGTPIDIGVQVFANLTVVKDYFKRFDVPLTALSYDPSQQVSANYDLRTGKEVTVTSPAPADVAAALAKLGEFLSKCPQLDHGMFLPDPVPEDLVLPFGEFVKKYGLEAAVPTIYTYNPGLGDVLTGPTIEQTRNFGLTLLNSLANGFLTTAHHNTSELYTKAQAELLSASSLLLSSEVVHSDRDEQDGVSLIVKTPTSKKIICAKKLLITIPAKLDFLAPFDLSDQEKDIFGRLLDAGYYTGILKNTGLPDNLNLLNAREDTPYNLPVLPAPYFYRTSAVSGLTTVNYGTQLSKESFPMSDEDVKADLINSLKKVQVVNPDKYPKTEPEFVTYSSHAPFYMQFPAQDTKNGYYAKMYALQGLRNTYWNGATFMSQDSSLIWRFTEETVLPQLLKGL